MFRANRPPILVGRFFAARPGPRSRRSPSLGRGDRQPCHRLYPENHHDVTVDAHRWEPGAA
jgi:hypothetical protein